MDLRLDDDDLANCVQCGLCLPQCPTYRVSGEEAWSPRGRIAAMREVQRDGVIPDAAWLEAIDSCVQCRACEPACPSGVRFGHLMETTRTTLVESGTLRPPRWARWGVRLLDRPVLLSLGASSVVAMRRIPGIRNALLRSRLGAMFSAVPASRPLVQAVLRTAPAPAGDAVWLVTGCVMDAVQRDVHQATIAVLEAVGYGVRLSPEGRCCGALAAHLGLAGRATRQATSLMASYPGEDPVVVNAAGCGARLLELEQSADDAVGRRFSARVADATSVVAERVDRLPAPASGARRPRIAIQDPCHLRNVQRSAGALRTVLGRYAELVELDSEGLCCGAGGAYAQVRPDDAAAIRLRTTAAIGRAGAELVVTANPGCELHLRNAGVEVEHVMVTLARLAGLADVR